MRTTTWPDKIRTHFFKSTPPEAALEGSPILVRMPTADLGWSVFRNTASQIGGRGLIALLRLVVAGMIVRSYGPETFGEFSLVFGILTIAEWLLDFGTTDAFVREISRDPEGGPRLLRIMTAAKLVQVPVAWVALVAILIALRYPARIVEAGIVGGAGMVFLAGMLVYHTIFKASLRTDREVAAELVSTVVLIPLVWLVASRGGGLTALVGCQVASRAVFFGLCLFFGSGQHRLSLQGVAWRDVRWGLEAAAPLGIIGLLVGVYETLDILLLSKLGTFSELAYYSGAQRLVWPVFLALTAIGGTLYPIVASSWPHARSKIEQASQRGLDTAVVLAGFALCSYLAAPDFFMGLIGPELADGAAALQILAVVCCVKAISAIAGPILVAAQAQKQALQLVAAAVVVKAAVLVPLIPQFGYVGVAFGVLAVESCLSAVAALYLVRRFTGFRWRWSVPLKVMVVAVAAALAPRLVLSSHGFQAAVAAPMLYVAAVFLSGAVRVEDVRSLLQRKTP
ncbi:MAG: oligosaccharide flippase family protein [Terriglobia bacterium]